jgi:hypothetical protein
VGCSTRSLTCNLEVDLIFFDTTSTYVETEDAILRETRVWVRQAADLPRSTSSLFKTRQADRISAGKGQPR